MEAFETTSFQFKTNCLLSFIKNLVNFVQFHFSIYLYNFTRTKKKTKKNKMY